MMCDRMYASPFAGTLSKKLPGSIETRSATPLASSDAGASADAGDAVAADVPKPDVVTEPAFCAGRDVEGGFCVDFDDDQHRWALLPPTASGRISLETSVSRPASLELSVVVPLLDTEPGEASRRDRARPLQRSDARDVAGERRGHEVRLQGAHVRKGVVGSSIHGLEHPRAPPVEAPVDPEITARHQAREAERLERVKAWREEKPPEDMPPRLKRKWWDEHKARRP